MTRRGAGAERVGAGGGVGAGGDADGEKARPKRGGARMRVVARSPDGPVIDATLLQSFAWSLEAADKSPETVKAYTLAVRQFVAFCAERLDLPDVRVRQVERHHIEAWQRDQLDRLSRTSASAKHAWLKAFWRWAVEDDRCVEPPGPMAGVRQPKADSLPRPVLRDGDIAALLDTCKRDQTFFGLRDEALVRVLLDTGARRGGLTQMRWSDLDWRTGEVRIRAKRGSGTWDEYFNLFGKRTLKALGNYRREAELCSPHYAADGPMWLGMQGPLTRQGVYEVVKRRGKAAGCPRVFTHLFRHTAAHHSLADGMSDRDVMALFNWRSPEVAMRYGKQLDAERALEHKRGKSLSDRF